MMILLKGGNVAFIDYKYTSKKATFPVNKNYESYNLFEYVSHSNKRLQ